MGCSYRLLWICEISELAGLKKADVDNVKSFLSRQSDRTRPAYGRFVVDRLRRCIFIGTVNGGKSAGYLSDPTGARRFWPVEVGRIDLEALRRDRDQLWAEAAYWEARGEELTIPASLFKDAEAEQEKRRIHDPWMDILETVNGERVETSEGPAMRVGSSDLMTRDLGLQKAQLTARDAARVGAIMRQLGWTGPKLIRLPKPGEPQKLGLQAKG
jgi:putative DNA primase/helicase